jgi:hypothetical protein
MEPPTILSNHVTTLDPAVVLEKPISRPGVPTWQRRAGPSRAGALLRSVPSQVFLVALAGYIALTLLHLWVTGVPSSQQSAPLTDWWPSAFTAAWRRFDSIFFLRVAQHGYTNQSIGAFFPLYPLLIRLFAWPLFGHFTLAALLVSWLCAWGSYAWFFRLARREFGERVARYALLFFALSPVSFFSFAPYSEALFLLVSIGAVERARAGRLWQASALAALGMLTRPTGILLLIPLAWEWARRVYLADACPAWVRKYVPRWLFQPTPPDKLVSTDTPAQPLPRLAWLSLGLVPLALLGYMLFLKLRTGSALAFLAGESLWHRHITLPWDTAGLFGLAFQNVWQTGDTTALIGNIVDLLLVIPLPALVLYCAIRSKKLWLGAALYQVALTLLLIAVPNVPGPHGQEVLLSTQRFMLPAFPVFLLVGQLGNQRPWLYRVLLIASAAMLLLNTWNFLNNIFIA